MSDTKRKILETLQRGRGFLASLATITEDGAPWARYVTGTIDDELTIRIATSLHSKKVAHVRARPEVHLACGNIDPSVEAPYFQIEATAEISTDPEEKQAIWNDGLAFFFQTPENPDWCVLKARPHRITVHSMTSMDTEVWTK
jgi:general stress protein 26